MYKAYNTRLVCRKVEEPTERVTKGGIIVPENAKGNHYITAEIVDAPLTAIETQFSPAITSPDIGRKVLISSSTPGQDGFYFPETENILAYVE